MSSVGQERESKDATAISSPSKSHFNGAQLITREDFEYLLRNEHVGPDWTPLSESPLIKTWKKKHESGLLILRCEGVIRGHSVRAITDVIYNIEINKQWNDGFDQQIVLPNVDELNNVIYLKSKSPMLGIARRTLVQFRCLAYVDGASIIVFRDGSHPDYPPENETWLVRAHTIGVTGYVIRSLADVRRRHATPKPKPDTEPASTFVSQIQKTLGELHLSCISNCNGADSAISPHSPGSTGPSPASLSAARARELSLSLSATDSSSEVETDAPGGAAGGGSSSEREREEEEAASGVRLTFQTCIDPRGSIPVALVNWVASKFGPRWITNLQNACDRFDPR